MLILVILLLFICAFCLLICVFIYFLLISFFFLLFICLLLFFLLWKPCFNVLLFLLFGVINSHIITVCILLDKFFVFGSPQRVVFHCLCVIILHLNNTFIQSLQKCIRINQIVSTNARVKRRII